MVFENLVVDPAVTRQRPVSMAEYDAWRRHFVFDGLRNLSYGESFCRHFDIQDHILRFSQTVREADDYIQRFYLRSNKETRG
jgi:hypothetical protein